jgi:hypothetical protein
MAVSDDLLMAILSMDAYARGAGDPNYGDSTEWIRRASPGGGGDGLRPVRDIGTDITLRADREPVARPPRIVAGRETLHREM